MRDSIIRAYHRMPPGVRSIAATLRGMHLNLWRHGRQSDRLIAAALARETWSDGQWRAWHEEQLAQILHRAVRRVPYYREHWAARRRKGDGASWEVLENWPILEKEVLRQRPHAFVADDRNVRRMYREQTSGTTGTPLSIWRARPTVQALYALAHARTRRWNEIPEGARYARLGGQLVVPSHQTRPPFWVWNAAMRQLYMSTFHLSPELLPFYLDALKRYRICYLAGYPSSLAALARAALREKRTDLTMKAVFTNAESLSAEQRSLIGQAFHCPVRETYGMAENVAAASECPAGRLHAWPEVGLIEVHDEEGRVPSGRVGELICTGLLNPDMPLIRYRVGDRGCLASETTRCECGRNLPVIEAIDGRNTEMLLTRDGRQVFWLNPVFYGLPVREAQIVQESFDRLLVRIAPEGDFGEKERERIRDKLEQRMGRVRVDFDIVDHVPRTPAGKLQTVVCRIPQPQREAAQLRATTS